MVDNAPARIVTDEQRLRQILKNLLSNAIRFIDQGSVSLRIGLATTNRPTSLSGVDEVIAFSVVDTGIGIPEDARRSIFEAFQQADGTISRSHGGTGLGLTISRDLARLLGGELKLVSSNDSGSVFKLYIPTKLAEGMSLAPAETLRVTGLETPVLPPAAESMASLAGSRVLVVDDDVRNIFALSRVLTDAGMVVESATNGQMCLDKLEAGLEFDLVLMDVMMPVMDGLEAMRQIRLNRAFRELPIIAVTARAGSEDRQECLDAGANDFLSKPVDTGELFSAMQPWLSHATAGRDT